MLQEYIVPNNIYKEGNNNQIDLMMKRRFIQIINII